MIAPMVARVGNDGVITRFGMGEKPPAAIVGIDVNFWVLEKRLNHRVLRNELKISGIDFHRVQCFYLGVVRENLSPGAGRQAYNKDSPRSGTKGAEGVYANYQVGVMNGIHVEIAIVNAAAEHRSVLCHSDNAVPIFHHVSERYPGFRPIAENQPFEQQRIQS